MGVSMNLASRAYTGLDSDRFVCLNCSPMDHPNENNIPVAADAENQSAVRLAIESTPPGDPGPINRHYAKQIRRDLLARAKNPLAIGLTATEVRALEQDENTREREAPILTATEARSFEPTTPIYGFTKETLTLPPEMIALEDARRRVMRLGLANVLPKGIRDKDRELQRRLVTAGIDAGIDWQYRGYGEGDDAWSKPCSASSSRPLWFPMLEYRLCPEAVERRIAETWTDYATRGIDAEEPYCRPTETSDWLWKVLLWCFMFLAAVIGGAYAWQFFLR